MRSHGSAEELQRRRLLAVRRVREGKTHAQVAQFLGVHVRSVDRWMASYRQQGLKGLKAQPHPGRPPKLTPQRAGLVLHWLRKSPMSFGFATELWSAPRVAQVIERKWGVRFHPRYLNEWLTARGVTPQKPETQARERDPAQIKRWLKHDWPRIQNKRAANALPLF